MKKLSLLITALFLQIIPFCATSAFAETYVPSRMIHIVYDDSGSMIKDDDQVYVDTWCQAKYAMEIVTAMLGERDTLRIYYMSDFDKGKSGEPMSLRGSRNPDVVRENVAKIHDKVTAFSDTPFAAVKRAGLDFKTSEADENWLVILTDGEFDNTSRQEVENYYYQVAAAPNTKVIMLAMGTHVSPIDADPARGVYFEHAQTSDAIRGKLTSICNRIFQRNALPPIEQNSVHFGVPMNQLIVFAQGNDVRIGTASAEDGTQFTAVSNVHAAFSETAALKLPYPENVVVNRTLNGQIATFDGDFKPGSYKFDISGADNIEIYYKPNVEIATYLFDDIGNEVTKEAKLLNGTYRVEFGFIGATDGVRVEDTSLLGNISYSAEIVNVLTDGSSQKMDVKSGDTMTIREGDLNVDVTAKFLEYNTVNTKASYHVFFANELVWSFDSKPTYSLVKEGFENGTEPIVVHVRMKDGDAVRELTPAEWEVMAAPRVKYLGRAEDKDNKDAIGEFTVAKQPETGKFTIIPALSDDGPMKTSTGTLPIGISGGFSKGDSTASGSIKDAFEIADNITSWERFLNWLEENWHWLWKALVGFILFLGYAFKKRLPKGIKKAPNITANPARIGLKPTSFKASYKKNPLQILVPFRADTAVLSFPSSLETEGIPKTFRLKAAGGKRMHVTNKSIFAEKKGITINGTDGTQITKKSKRPLTMTANSTIEIKTKDYKYSCTLNQ